MDAGETFARNLSRMYGDDLPPNSAKELHCGNGPFLVAVVEDLRPRYRLRRTNRGLRILNSAVFDARRRYRRWTDGGYKVHASDSVAETRAKPRTAPRRTRGTLPRPAGGC